MTTYTITGKLTEVDGTVIAQATIKIVEKKLRGNKTLKSVITNEKGNYEAVFRKQSDKLDLFARAILDNKKIAESEINYDVNGELTIDLVVDNEEYKGPSEYQEVSEKINAVLDDISARDIEGDDLVYISKKSGVTTEQVARYAMAEKLGGELNVDSELLYGLYRQNLPVTLAGLSSQSTERIESAIDSAVSANIINSKKLENKTVLTDTLLNKAIDWNMVDEDDDGKASVGALLKTVISEDKSKKFLKTFKSHKGDSTSFWNTIREHDDFQDETTNNKIKFTLQSGYLTNYHLPLVKKLQEISKNKENPSLKSFVSYSKKDWLNVFEQKVDGEKIGVPKNIDAETNYKKKTIYAEYLEKSLEYAYPTQKFTVNLLFDSKYDNSDINLFYQKTTDSDFDLKNTNIKSFVETLDVNFTNKTQLITDLQAQQRLFRISPDRNKFEVYEELKKADLTDSISIKRMGKVAFVALAKEIVGSEELAVEMFEKASYNTDVGRFLMMRMADSNDVTASIMSGKSTRTEDSELEIPSYETLFGSNNYCDCEDCKSVYGASAYMVDILQFLDRHKIKGTGPLHKKTALDYLFYINGNKTKNRRPDLGEIKLTCENTNTPVPYVDLVNEILENAVLENSDGRELTFYQTTLSEEELKTNPENINAEAYELLGQQIYPLSLPLNYWNDKARIYLKHLDINRYDLMEKFRLNRGAVEPSDLDIACEYLRISENDRKIITGKTYFDGDREVYEFVGLDLDTYNTLKDSKEEELGVTISDWKELLSFFDIFIDRFDISFDDLLKLLQVDFIQQEPKISKSYGVGADTCNLSLATLTNTHYSKSGRFFKKVYQFLRLRNKLGWDILELHKSLIMLEISTLNDEAIVKLSRVQWIKENLGVDLDEILSWYANINTLTDANEENGQSFYETLFLNKTVNDPSDIIDSVFKLNDDKDELKSSSTSMLSDYTSNIISALNISSSDFYLLIEFLTEKGRISDNLNMANLSALYRYANFAEVNNLSVEELIWMDKLIEIDPFDAEDISATISYIKTVSKIKDSGFDIETLNYLFRNFYNEASGIAITDETISTTLEEVRTELQKFEMEYKVEKDTNGELFQERLSVFIDEETAIEFNNDLEKMLNNATDKDAVFDDWSVYISDLIGYLPKTSLDVPIFILNETIIKDKVELTHAENPILADTDDSEKEAISLSIKNEIVDFFYNYFMEISSEYLKGTLQMSSIIQTVSTAFELDSEIADKLLTDLVEIDSKKIVSLFLDKGFIAYADMDDDGEADTITDDQVITSDNYPDLFDAYRLIYKVSLLINGFGIEYSEIDWIFSKGADIGWLNMNELPTEKQDNGYALFSSWSRMVDHFSLTSGLSGGDTNIYYFYDTAIAENDNPGSFEYSDPADAKISELITVSDDWDDTEFNFLGFLKTLSEYTGWSFTDLAYLSSKRAYGLQYTDFKDEQVICFLNGCFQLIDKIGVSAEEIWTWLSLDLDDQRSSSVKQAVKAKYSYSDWLEKAPDLRNELREKQRAALVAHLLYVKNYSDSTKLFDEYLIDVEMSPCMMTSRIVQANASIQLFVQRCLLNLEPEIVFSEKEAADWEWMKNYRVWEVSRKVFLYPENWIEPELRDTKSPFFEDLENELLQNEVTDDTVTDAIKTYLEKLDSVSNIEVCAFYHEVETKENEVEIDIIHVFGRTLGNPHIYYYRTFEHSQWSAWEKVDLDIEGDHLMPIVFDRRLFLYWLVFTISDDSTDDLDFYSLALARSEYKNDTWQSKIVSDKTVSKYPTYHLNKPKGVFLRSSTNDVGDLIIRVYYPVYFIPFDEGSGTFDGFYSEITWKVIQGIGSISYYYWSYINYPEDLIVLPDRTEIMSQSFARSYSGSDTKLYMPVAIYNESIDYSNYDVDSIPILEETNKNNSLNLYKIIYPHQFEDFVCQDIFFYQDDYRTFMVEPNISNKKISLLTEIGYSHDFMQNEIINENDRDTDQNEFDDSNLPNDTDIRFSLFSDPSKFKFISENLTSSGNSSTVLSNFTFHCFFHPFNMLFTKTLGNDGIDGLLSRSIQMTPPYNSFSDEFLPKDVVNLPYPLYDVDFSSSAAFKVYNWELFFHIPLLLADRLSQNQRFEEAHKWFHYIFNPTDTSNTSGAKRYWQFKPFYDETDDGSAYDSIEELFYLLGEGSGSSKADELRAQIEIWRRDPFDPHAIAALRPVAYMKATFMKYLDNLIAWGDYLFSQDTIETINEATQLYLMAYSLIGDKPVSVDSPDSDPKTYNELSDTLDDFSNAFVEIEQCMSGDYEVTGSSDSPQTNEILYFCIPNNERIISYFETIEDRLYKIRNCMNIEGVERSLALFAPEIDPAALVNAVASGASISSALSDLNAALPYYRFRVMLQKAVEFCADVKVLGNALLTALEKNDADEIARIRSANEIQMLELARDIKELQIEEAKESLAGIEKSKEITQNRFDYYSNIEKINSEEQQHLDLLSEANILQGIGQGYDLAAQYSRMIPETSLGLNSGVTYGGANIGDALAFYGSYYRFLSSIVLNKSNRSSIKGGHERRWNDWKLQETMAEKELEQLEVQIESANIRIELLEKELDNHEKQIELSKSVDDFMYDKYTNQELYSWMVTQVSNIYFQSYQMAYDLGKKAQKAFQYELDSDKTYIQYGYWDSLKKGLMSGDKLLYDLRRMELAYFEMNKRKYEITKNISILQLDPQALIDLRTNGSCNIEIPEVLFDLDYPGHYLRRIKSVSLTIPCVAGPNTSINCTLTLVKSRWRKETSGDYKEGDTNSDDRFVYIQGSTQSIVTSRAQNDSGLFQLNFEDERYLPFEGAGAISTWQIKLPTKFRSFDYNTISDVILTMNYTAKDGGETLKSKVEASIQSAVESIVQNSGSEGLTMMISLSQDFSNEWYGFLNPPGDEGNQELTLSIDKTRFPYVFQQYLTEEPISAIKLVEIRQSNDKAKVAGPVKLSLIAPDGDNKAISSDSGIDFTNGGDDCDNCKELGDYKLWATKGTVTSDIVRDIVLLVSYNVSL